MEDRLMDANTEDYLEILYWEFDSEKKKFSFTERDLFKAKMRGLIQTIQNTRTSALPTTGSVGTVLFAVLGIALMAGAVWLYARSKRQSAK